MRKTLRSRQVNELWHSGWRTRAILQHDKANSRFPGDPPTFCRSSWWVYWTRHPKTSSGSIFSVLGIKRSHSLRNLASRRSSSTSSTPAWFATSLSCSSVTGQRKDILQVLRYKIKSRVAHTTLLTNPLYTNVSMRMLTPCIWVMLMNGKKILLQKALED